MSPSQTGTINLRNLVSVGACLGWAKARAGAGKPVSNISDLGITVGGWVPGFSLDCCHSPLCTVILVVSISVINGETGEFLGKNPRSIWFDSANFKLDFQLKMLFLKIRFGKMAVPLVCHLRLSVKRLEEQIQECPALPNNHGWCSWWVGRVGMR